MRNVEKYLINILDDNLCRYIYNLRTGESCPRGWEDSRERCLLCHQLNAKWLEAEYVEPEIDWSKVEQGTMVYSNVYGTEGECGKFVGLYKNRIVMETSEYKYRSYHKDHCRLEK